MEKNNWDDEENQDNGSEDHHDNDHDEQYKDKFDPNSHEAIVKGLSFKAEGEDVRNFFSQYGEIENVNIERRYNGDSKGSCFIKFATKEGLDKAIAATGVEFMGRQVWVDRTRAKSDRVKDFGPKKSFRGGSGYGSRGSGGYGSRGTGGSYGSRGTGGSYGSRGTGGYRGKISQDYSDRPPRTYGRGGSGRGGYRNEDGDFSQKKEGYGGRGGYSSRGSNFVSSRGRGGSRGGYKKQHEEVEQSKILFVGNLNYRSEKDEIWEFFDTKGKVVDVRIARNPAGSKKGFAYVEFETFEDAEAALELNGQELAGRELRVDLASPLKN